MNRRSSKYVEETVSTKPKSTRTNKNKYLYDEKNDRIGYEGIIDISEISQGALDTETPIRTREEYQQSKKEQVVIEEPKTVETTEKVYDINSVLENAKKNRSVTDEADKRRKKIDTEYSLLNDLNKKYQSKREKMEEDLEKEGIREVIDTITSKSLSDDIKNAANEEQDLMSDLLATNTMSALSNEQLQEEIAKELLNDDNNESTNDESEDMSKTISDSGKIINSFYTRSMDLSEQDFELRDEIIEENKAKRKVIILLILIILILIAIGSFFILKKLDII